MNDAELEGFCARLEREVEGCMTPSAMVKMYREAREQREVGDIVETGVFMGRTSIMFAQAILDRGSAGLEKYWGIDPCGTTPHEKDWWAKKVRATWEEWNVDRVCNLIVMRSEEAIRMGVGSTIRLVHVDGEHTGKAPTDDILWAISRMEDGGVLIVDDANWDDVKRGIDAGVATGRLTQRWYHTAPENGTQTACYRVAPKEEPL